MAKYLHVTLDVVRKHDDVEKSVVVFELGRRDHAQSLRRGYLKERILRRLIDKDQNGEHDHGHQRWALFTFEIWHQAFMDREMNS